MTYQPIEDYGIIGNMHSAALVGKNGSIDWFCFPHFDSPSVFAAILDEKKGGHFSISPIKTTFRSKQFYWPDTNVLVTLFLSPDGVGEVRDYMPINNTPLGDIRQKLIRRIKVLRGSMTFRIECVPAFNYARDKHITTIEEYGARFDSPKLTLGLYTTATLHRNEAGVSAEFMLEEEQISSFLLTRADLDSAPQRPLSDQSEKDLFVHTVEYWRRWLSKCAYSGRWREIVHRSALTLKLLTFEPTGAIIAAPTCSLPETIGGIRNWDYRYTWVRDAAFTLYGLMRIGFTEEAVKFMEWLDARCHEIKEDGSLQTLYSIEGQHSLKEEILDHLEGYRGSGPVRVGNAAHSQLQLDIYGELIDSVYLFNKYGPPISYDLWKHLRRMINWVCEHWKDKDEGIWEMRRDRQHFVHSKLMCWVALDRGLRLAIKRSFPADWDRWYRARDEIYEEIMTLGWNKDSHAFVQSYGSTALDASILMMPLVFFLSPTDPRMLKTLDAINKSTARGGLAANGLVYRYNINMCGDGIVGDEGTFNMCTFWLVEAMTRAGRYDRSKLNDARLMFERMLGFANHVGLYAEETGSSGEALGNFPQGFTHLALISAAFNLDRALGTEQGLS